MKKTATSSSVEDGLAEMSGVALCAAPRCYAQLKPGQGVRTSTPTKTIRTCHSRLCTGWATEQASKETAS